MRSWRPKTLDGKLKMTVVLTTMLALVLSLAGIILGQIVFAREGLLREMETLAEVLGANGAAALVFLQPDDAERILSSLDAKPHVIGGDFLTPEARVFATYSKHSRPELPDTGPMSHAFTVEALVVRRDVVRDGESIGEVRLISSLEPVYRRILVSAGLAVLIFVGCALLALWVAYRWLNAISRPIHDLVSTADRIAKTHDYSLRAEKYQDDELGRLTDGFNQMLDQIIEQQRLERHNQELVEMQHKLEAQNAELERFTYTVSHDLKSPLFTIQGFLGMLEQDTAEGNRDGQRTSIAYIRSAAEKMQQLLDELLELSRIGRVVNPAQDVALDALVEEAIDLTRGLLQQTDVELRVPSELPRVHGDLPRLREVFQNLIANAVRYRDPERDDPYVEIDATRMQDEVVCVVRDNGIGIDPAHHEKIFGLFETLHGKSGGTGIGLALVRRIIEHHGGRIWVESELGGGAAFFFTLPDVPSKRVDDHSAD